MAQVCVLSFHDVSCCFGRLLAATVSQLATTTDQDATADAQEKKT